MLNYPTHLTCPYCPAQASPSMLRGIVGGRQVRLYVCPSKHQFYVHPDTKESAVFLCSDAAYGFSTKGNN